MPLLNFNAEQVRPWEAGSGVRFPLADYPFTITAVEQKMVKGSQTSGLLEVEITVMAGEFKGQKQKTNFNIYNESPRAQEIGFAQLSALCHSIGRLHIQDTSQLIGGNGIATIGPQEGSDKYSEVKMWKDINSRQNGKGDPIIGPAPVFAAQLAAAPVAAASASPWATATPAPAQSASAAPWGATAQNPPQAQPTPFPGSAAPPVAASATTPAAAAQASTASAAPPWATPASQPPAPFDGGQSSGAPPWATK